MHTLYITQLPAGGITVVRATRDAMRLLGTPGAGGSASASDADKLLNAYERDGYALVGQHADPLEIAAATRILENAGITAVMDFEPESRRAQSREDREAGLTPEEVFETRAPGVEAAANAAVDAAAGRTDPEEFVYSSVAYETALAVLAMSDGNPVEAAAKVHLLSRTTQDADLYTETQYVLCKTFPWIRESLNASDLRLWADTE